MPHMIESAKSGRASCRVCRKKIEKGELRFGEEAPNAFDPDGGSSYFWHHLACAAQKKPNELKQALAAFTGEIPNRAEIDALLQAAPPDFPYAERAPTGRSKCLACGTAFITGEKIVALVLDDGKRDSAWLHPACEGAGRMLLAIEEA